MSGRLRGMTLSSRRTSLTATSLAVFSSLRALQQKERLNRRRRRFAPEPSGPNPQMGCTGRYPDHLRIARFCGGRRAYELCTSLNDAVRLAGSYTGQILKGEHPADLP